MTQLIISEKPSAAEKIATALAEGKIEKKKVDGITYYHITRHGEDIIVGCSVGHLYNVGEKDKKGWTYPVFSVEWKPTYETDKSARNTKNFVTLLQKLAKEADSFIVACDYDIEGEVIGLNIVRFACKQKDADRMKFSTLTKDELIDSYEHRQKHLDWGQAHAGETRHVLDWFYGMNLSRALTLSIKAVGAFKIMSSGRVQGPALKLLASREKEIRSFKPEPFWQLELLTKNDIKALHVEEKFWDKSKAEASFANAKDHDAKVSHLERKETPQAPPHPFDLTSLQIEAYKTLRISPKQTLSMAQNLYVSGAISYPRTSSNQLPPSLDYKKIISSLKKQEQYKTLCERLLSKPLKPNNGKKTDPAHPAIYPTGEIPKTSSAQQRKLYDLIVRRTLATFGTFAIRETLTIDLDVNNEMFKAKGTLTKVPGWHEYYGPFVMLDETELPQVSEGEVLQVKKLDMLAKETQPPKRYSPASVIKDLEKRGLGTKATRAAIVDSLFQRGYVSGDSSIEVTDLGMHTIETLEKFCPEILDEELTREFERDMDLIREGKKSGDQILDAAQKHLTKLLAHFKENEKQIGQSLLEAHRDTQNAASILGKCPKCNEHDLRILYSRKTKKSFVACSGYPKCENTYSLPSGKISPTDKSCEFCNTPIVKVIRAGKRPFQMCLTFDCKSKESWKKKDVKPSEAAPLEGEAGEGEQEDFDQVTKEIMPKKKRAKKATKKVAKKKSKEKPQ